MENFWYGSCEKLFQESIFIKFNSRGIKVYYFNPAVPIVTKDNFKDVLININKQQKT